VYAAADAALHRFTDRPVLPVGDIPEFNRIAGVEVRLADLARLEQEMTDDVGAFGAARLQMKAAT